MPEENVARTESNKAQAVELLHELKRQEKGAPEKKLADYPYSGNATIVIILFGAGKVQVVANFDSGDRLQYDAWVGGDIAGAGGISFGGGAFNISPSDLLKGEVCCGLTLSPAGTAILFFRDGKLIGSFIGGGPNVGVGAAGGCGNWKKA